jgi:hypothetical protein
MRGRRRFTVVSGYGNRPLTPRGQRTRHLVQELGRTYDVSLIAMPPEPGAASAAANGAEPAQKSRLGKSILKAAGRASLHTILLDRWEPWSLRRLARWSPDADAALLVATPWSPVIHAGRRLGAQGIPYVVDAGDPWVLTASFELKGSWVRRARRAERSLWANAAGAVVTTPGQRDRLRQVCPELPILVRPNGYEPVDVPAAAPPSPHDPSCLKLAHFGMLTPRRVDVVPLLAELERSGRWRSIRFAQFGEDYESSLQRLPAGIEVERHAARPWPQVVEKASEYDAAIVVGNPLGELLPSKAVQYLTLPIPRIALTNPDPRDALREFASDRPGWLVVSEDEADPGARVWGHLGENWSTADLRAPEAEAWPAVGRRIVDFIASCVDPTATGSPGERELGSVGGAES